MELSTDVQQLQKIPQPQIIIFRNITKIISRSYLERPVVNPSNDMHNINLWALLMVLVLGFFLGIGAMFIYLRFKKWQSKSQKVASIKRSDSQKSIAESESSNSLKNNCHSFDSRSTSARSSPDFISESDDRETIPPISLENRQDKTADTVEAKGAVAGFSDSSEMKLACFKSNILEKEFCDKKASLYGGNQMYDLLENLSQKDEKLLQLKLKREYPQSSSSAEIPHPETNEKIKFHQSNKDINSLKEESEIQVHEKDGKIIKIEKTVNTTVYCDSKTEELKQLINNCTNAIQNNREEHTNMAFHENKLALPASENDKLMLADRKFSDQLKELRPISPLPRENEPQNSQHQANPVTEINEGKVHAPDFIGILRSPSPCCSSKPLPTSQGFPHLTGFFEQVFGDKTLIGRGGFGEVYKVTHKLEQKLYAVKKVKLFVRDGEDIRQNKLFREVFAMTSLHHPNIVRHHTTWTEEPPSNLTPEQILRKSITNRKLTLIRKSQETLTPAEHTKISELGFEWDVSNKDQAQNSKSHKLEEEIISDPEDLSNPCSRIKTISKVQTSILEGEEEKNDDDDQEALSALNASILNKLKNHQLIYLFLQMEYCSGDSLMNYLDNPRNPKNLQEIFKVFKQVLEGVSAIHESGILHRDLKPSNIFFEKGIVKIGDFGLSWLGEQQDDGLEPALNLSSKEEIKARGSNGYTSNIGTPFYISPEQEKSTIYDNKTDIYSLGIILFELISFFKTRHERGDKIKALREEGLIDPKVYEQFPELSKLVLTMTNKNPYKRPSTKEALATLERIGSNTYSLGNQ